MIISVMEAYEHNKNADADVVIKSKWVLDYIQEITASVVGQKKRKQAEMKSEEYSNFIISFLYLLLY